METKTEKIIENRDYDFNVVNMTLETKNPTEVELIITSRFDKALKEYLNVRDINTRCERMQTLTNHIKELL